MNPIYKIIKSSYKNSLDYARSNNPQVAKEYKAFFEAGLEYPAMARLLKNEASWEYSNEWADKWSLEMNRGKTKEPFVIVYDSCKAMLRLLKLRYFDKEISALNKNFNREYNNLYPNTKDARKKIIDEGRILSDGVVQRKRRNNI